MKKLLSSIYSIVTNEVEEEGDVIHNILPNKLTYVEGMELENAGVTLYENDSGELWGISHTDEEYALVELVVDAYDK